MSAAVPVGVTAMRGSLQGTGLAAARVVLRRLVLFGALGMSSVAGATAYRCDDAGHVTYGNQPCTSGKQTEIGGASTPSAEDQAAAAARQRADAARLARLARERKQDERAATLATRRGNDRGNSMRSCTKLARDARRAHDDYDIAGPRLQPKARIRMQRADEDYAALCKRKP